MRLYLFVLNYEQQTDNLKYPLFILNELACPLSNIVSLLIKLTSFSG